MNVRNAPAGRPTIGSRYELVIFDCDGVLVDSEPLANRILQDRLATVGLHLSLPEVMGMFVGRTREGCIALASEMIGKPLPQDFAAEWDRILYAALREQLQPIAGVTALIDSLPMPYCTASNSSPERLRLGLDAAGLWERFAGRAFSAQEVALPKPAPDLFLYAAAKMAASPTRCAVIEDTPTGARAGIAAGMTVFAYTAAPHADREGLRAAGARIFERMTDLPVLLGKP